MAYKGHCLCVLEWCQSPSALTLTRTFQEHTPPDNLTLLALMGGNSSSLVNGSPSGARYRLIGWGVRHVGQAKMQLCHFELQQSIGMLDGCMLDCCHLISPSSTMRKLVRAFWMVLTQSMILQGADLSGMRDWHETSFAD